MKFQCQTCKGTYVDPCEDSMLYFHVCPEGKIEGSLLDETRRFVPFSDRRNENMNTQTGKMESEGKGRKEVVG